MIGDVVRTYAQPDLEPDRDSRWLEQARACHTQVMSGGADWWYSTNPVERLYAALICDECPFQVPCLQRAINNQENWGVHGGYDFTGGRLRRRAYCIHGHKLEATNRYVHRRRNQVEIRCRRCMRIQATPKNERERANRANKINKIRAAIGPLAIRGTIDGQQETTPERRLQRAQGSDHNDSTKESRRG